MKHGKKYNDAKKMIDINKAYPLVEAVELLKKTSFVKFDSSVDIAIRTNANPKFNDQMLRATTILPNGTGKSKRVAVFIAADKLDEAKKSGADIFGSEDIIKDIKNGKFDFDVLLTTPDSMRELVSVAKQLGPKGLMPSPKSGTVTTDLAQSVEEIKKGKVEFRLDKVGNIHAMVGKLSFDSEKLQENIESFLKSVVDNKPSGIKGKLIKKVVLSASMGPGIQVDYQD